MALQYLLDLVILVITKFVHFTYLILGLLHGSLLELVLDLPDEGRTHSLLELVCRGVEVEYLDDLGDPELVAHLTDARHVLLRLPRLEQLRGLDHGQQGVDHLGPVILEVLVPSPLLQLGHVVPDKLEINICSMRMLEV